MDFDLKEIAATLAIGVFLIFGIEFVILSFFGRVVTSKIGKRLETSQFVIGALVAALCFVTGMIVEDVSNKLVDEKSWLWLPLSVIVEPDHRIKSQIFFEAGNPTFAQQAAKYGLLQEFAGTNGEGVENALIQEICDPEDLKLLDLRPIHNFNRDDAALRFYYNAKAGVYQNQSYYDELKRLQMRIDCSRSLIAATLVLTLVVTGLWVGKGVILLLLIPLEKSLGTRPQASRFAEVYNWLRNLRDDFESPRIRFGRLLMGYCSLILILTSSIFAYKSEEEEFDKRIYGYYLAQMINSKDQPAQAKCRERIP
jgi:hypothetical protein